MFKKLQKFIQNIIPKKQGEVINRVFNRVEMESYEDFKTSQKENNQPTIQELLDTYHNSEKCPTYIGFGDQIDADYSTIINQKSYNSEKVLVNGKINENAYKYLVKSHIRPKTLTPNWQMYNDFTSQFHAIGTGINFIANHILGAGYEIEDKNGKTNPVLKKILEAENHLSDIIGSAVKHYLVYGQVIYTFYIKLSKTKQESTQIVLVPSSETMVWLANAFTFEAESFIWQQPFVQNIYFNKEDEQGDPNFYIGKIPGVDDQVFGESPLTSFFNEIDSYVKNSELFRLYLTQASYPGYLLKYFDGIPDDLRNKIQKSFAAWKQSENRFKAGMIPTKGIYGQDGKIQDIVEIEQPKFELQKVLTPEEVTDIERRWFRRIGVNPKLLDNFGSGTSLGTGDYEALMKNASNLAFSPYQRLIENDFKRGILARLITDEKIQELDLKIEDENGNLIPAKPEDFSLVLNEIDIELPSVKHQKETDRGRLYLDGVVAGIFSVAEAKKRGFDFKDDELTDKDNRILLPDNLAGTQQVVDSNVTDENKGDAENMGNLSQEATKDEAGDLIELEKAPKKENPKIKLTFNWKPEPVLKSFKEFKSTLKQKKKIQKEIADTELTLTERALKTQKAKALLLYLETVLTDQYSSLDFEQILADFDIENINEVGPEILEKIIDAVDQIENLDLDKNLISESLMYFGLLATEAEKKNYQNQTGETLSAEQIAQVEKNTQKYVTERIKALNGSNVKTNLDQILDASLDSGLSQTSKKRIVRIIKEVLVEAKTVEEAKKLIQEKIEKDIQERTENIATTEAAKATAVSQSSVVTVIQESQSEPKAESSEESESGGKKKKKKKPTQESEEEDGSKNKKKPTSTSPIKKKWLVTSSSLPRGDHLKTVGEIVGINDTFSNGLTWSGQLINCKCGIEIIY